MRIGIDLSVLSQQRTGIGNYAFNLARAFLDLKTEHEWVWFVPHNAPFTPSYLKRGEAELKIVVLPKKKIPIWDSHITQARIMKEQKLDVLHGPANTLPYFYKGRGVITAHDLAIYKHPEWFPKGQWLATKVIVPASIKKARKIIVPSQATKKDLQELFRVSDEKIAVIPHGIEERFFRPPVIATPSLSRGKQSHEIAASRFSAPRNDKKKKYILFVGTLEPRKNLDRVIEAYEGLPQEIREQYELWVAGGKGWSARTAGGDNRGEKGNKADKGVKYLDYVSYNDLPALYQNASLFVYPSLYEGFGLPVLEAMAAGVPVITSKGTAMEEIVKYNPKSTNRYSNDTNGSENSDMSSLRSNYALVDPYSVEEMKDGMERILASSPSQILPALVELGIKRAREFSWEKTAGETMTVYQELRAEPTI